MESEAPIDPFARLAPAARAPERARLRLGVGAAIVLLIAALVTTVIVSAIGQQAGRRVLGPAGADTSAGSGAAAGSADPGASGTGDDDGDGGTDPSGPSAGTGAIIFVHVLGAVRRPGLFELREGARVMDVIAAAGGLLETADPAGVNLARLVGDGEQLYVPRLGEAPPAAPPGGAAGTPPGGTAGIGGSGGGKVNLNTATVAELDTLPRIGPAMAQRIIDFRDANGRFAAVEDLLNVAGIGEKTFDGLKELVTT